VFKSLECDLKIQSHFPKKTKKSSWKFRLIYINHNLNKNASDFENKNLKGVFKMTKEENCIILDFLAQGYADRRHPEPVAQALGKHFSLLELVPKEGIVLKPEEEVYIGSGPRDKIRYIKRSLIYADLTNFGKNMLNQFVTKLVSEEEARFVEFFNKSSIITPRMHQLELIPGIGKKHVSDILDERRKKPFENYKDMVDRVKLFPDPAKAIIKRILMELEGEEKYHIFTPARRREEYGQQTYRR